MTRTVKDAMVMLQAICGYDPEDTSSADLPVPDYAKAIAGRTSSFRLGVPRAFFYEQLHPETQAAVQTALAVLKKLTASQRDLEPLDSDASYAAIGETFGNILRAEAYAYHQEFISKTPDLYQAETLKRLRAGAEVATRAYVQSRRRLDQMRRSVSRVFETVDLLLTPTSPAPPFTIDDLLSDLNTLRSKENAMLHNTRAFNVLGLPTISIPCGFTQAGLPIGMQISGAPGNEGTVLRLANAYEQATEWHQRRPSIAA
jgi:aspartyl-tRNA(Asn)/glutamyl-tRNA(Gln) amidotransferase subunit A